MLSSLRLLADAVSNLEKQGRANVTETLGALTVSGLRAPEAAILLPLLNEIGWTFEVVDSAGERADTKALTSDYEPFIITIEKENLGQSLQVVTLSGLKNFLKEERTEEIWEIATLILPFSTMSSSFLPWGSTAIFSAAPATKSPRQLVRDHSLPPRVPNDVRVWLPRTPANELLWHEPVFLAFADLSAQALVRALATEITGDARLVFRGPPRTELAPPSSGIAKILGLQGYNDLRAAAAWVYENSVEAEQRHGLFSAEFARNNPEKGEPGASFSQIASHVLDGSRLAYQLSLSDLSREAIKAQGDLRKAVTDDTAKLADNTRQVISAVAAALATCVGLIAARIGTTAPLWILQTIALISAIYIVAIVGSGLVFMNVQKDMRVKWRTRLYRFIPEEDYKAMVTDPASHAEQMFIISAISAGIVALFITIMAIFY